MKWIQKLMERGRLSRIRYLASHLEMLTRDEVAILDKSLGILERVLRDW